MCLFSYVLKGVRLPMCLFSYVLKGVRPFTDAASCLLDFLKQFT